MDANYRAGSAAYSPSLSDESPIGLVEEVTQQDRIGFSNHREAIPVVPPVPCPSVGGETGIAQALGWTKGLRVSRHWRQRFRGTVLVVPNQGPHPVAGPVGQSNRTGRLAANVDALNRTYLPSPKDIARSFVRPTPLALHMEEVGGNE